MPTTIDAIQGNDLVLFHTVLDEDGYAKDLTGYTALAQIRRGTADNAPVVAEFALQIDELSGKIRLSLDGDVTAGLTRTYNWELKLTAPDGTRSSPVYDGRLTMLPEVSREV